MVGARRGVYHVTMLLRARSLLPQCREQTGVGGSLETLQEADTVLQEIDGGHLD